MNFERQVEEALEHLFDFSYLGNHPLSLLACVQPYLPKDGRLSHLDRGRALHLTLREAINRLRPDASVEAASDAARFYSVLDLAYVKGESNESAANHLQISVRTFYRARHRAIQIVTQILKDWQANGRPAKSSTPPD